MKAKKQKQPESCQAINEQAPTESQVSENGYIDIDGVRTTIPLCKCGCGRLIRPVFFKGTWRLNHAGTEIQYFSQACRQRFLKAERDKKVAELESKVHLLEDEIRSLRQSA